jgi:hypothetical protein
MGHNRPLVSMLERKSPVFRYIFASLRLLAAIVLAITTDACASLSQPQPHIVQLEQAPARIGRMVGRALETPSRGAAVRTFYVSPHGRDWWRGSSPARPWKTISRVDKAALRPGDRVLFRGGATFGDTRLYLTRSGTRGRLILYGAYGGGAPTFTRGVFMSNVSWVGLVGLRIAGCSQGIASSSSGSVRHAMIIANSIESVGIGINSPNPRDTGWLVAANTVVHTGDSGLILQGSRFDVKGNNILDTGTNSKIPYGKHGIYAKGPRLTLVNNFISGFSDEGISTRYEDALIKGNSIHDGRGGIGYYRDDPGTGHTLIINNRIWNVDYGIYISASGPMGPTREHFVISGNSITASKVKIDLGPEVRKLTTYAP